MNEQILELTQAETKLFLSNHRTFLKFPRGAQVFLEQDGKVPEFGTVIGHELNCTNEIILVISVIRNNGEDLVRLHPGNKLRRVIKL